MIRDDGDIFYERELPHYQPLDGTYTVMFRLAGSLPAEVIARLRDERDEFSNKLSALDKTKRSDLVKQFNLRRIKDFDLFLDQTLGGHHWLKNPQIAETVSHSMHYWNKRAYDLLAYCIMPNHVHMVFSTGIASAIPLPDCPLKGPTPYHVTNIMTSIKKHSAMKANKLLHRSGPFWQDETFDHVVRNENELDNAIWYVLQNPVKAGLVNDWKDWRWTYVKEGLVD